VIRAGPDDISQRDIPQRTEPRVAERNAPTGSTILLHDENLFLSSSKLPVSSSWWASVLVATGGALMVVVSLGAMAGEIGNVSVWIWFVTAGVGGLICGLIAELAGRFPERAGGTPQFSYRARPGGSATIGALSAWCYWFAWTPGIAVNLILAATIIKDLFWGGVNAIALALVIGFVLYTITAMGLKLSTIVNAVLAVVALALILLIVLGPVLKPGTLHLSEVFPTRLPADAPHGAGSITLLIVKWGFVACWSSYAAEMASTVCSEIRNPERHMRRIMSISAVVCLVAFTVVPIALFATVGIDAAANDPIEVFGAAGQAILGGPGRYLVGVGLAAVLVLGAETFIIGSSRTIYQMSMDGHLPPTFATINRRGAPVGSIAWDALVIITMLLVFGTDVVNVVAAANVGYLVVFVILPFAYLMLRKMPGGRAGAYRLPKAWVAIAIGIAVFNAVLLVVGGVQWGASVMGIGIGVSAAILPISWATRRWHARHAETVELDRSPEVAETAGLDGTPRAAPEATG
jgi:amino acid transporter